MLIVFSMKDSERKNTPRFILSHQNRLGVKHRKNLAFALHFDNFALSLLHLNK